MKGQQSFEIVGETLVWTLDQLINVAIKRLQNFEPEEGYYLAFSGGKDSVVIKALADMAKVKYDMHYAVTTVDPPDLTRFIKENYPECNFSIPEVNMWDLIVKRKTPPTRLVRYCCQALKEEGGSGRVVVTGVRWDESPARRKSRHGVEFDAYGSEKKSVKEQRERFYRMNDNGKRRAFEVCPTGKKGKHIVNPIVEWTDEHIWEFIHRFNVPYCKLYDEGHKRLGCLGCPLQGKKIVYDFFSHPYIFRKYLITFEKMNRERLKQNMETTWVTGHDVMRWWIRMEEDQYLEFLKEMQEAFIKDGKGHWQDYADINKPIIQEEDNEQ